MKKLFLITILMIWASVLKAQGLGVQFGYNFANVSGLDLLNFEEINSVGEINFGANYDIEVGENFFIEP